MYKFIIFLFIALFPNYLFATTIICSTDGVDAKKEIKIVKEERKVYIRKYGITDRWQQNQDYVIKDLGIVWVSPWLEDNQVEISSLTTTLKSQRSNFYDFKIDKNHFESWLLANNIPLEKARKDRTVLFNYIYEHIKDKPLVTFIDWKCK